MFFCFVQKTRDHDFVMLINFKQRVTRQYQLEWTRKLGL